MIKLFSLHKVASVTTAATYAVGGVGFALATVVMARVLDETHFATAVLIIALCNLGAATAAAGINGVVVRRDLRADTRLLVASVSIALAVAVGVSATGHWAYGLRAVETGVLFAAVLIGGTALTVVSSLQRAQAFQRAALLSQSASIGLLLASALMLLGFGRDGWFPVMVVACSFGVIGSIGWRWALAWRNGESIRAALWRDGLDFTGVAFAGEALIQIERFLIPLVLYAQDLAVFAVVAAVALAPYRVLEMGANATLPARLRRLKGGAERRRLLVQEAAWLMALSVLGGVVLVLIGPFVCRLVLPDEAFSTSLMIAVVFSGVARVLAALSRGLSGAVCAGRELTLVHAAAWLSLAVAATCGFLLSAWGLPGLVWGVACGWMCRAVVTFGIASKHLSAEADIE